MPDPRNTPVAVRSPYRAKVTEIDWADGHKGVYPHEILRGYCPCAGCQGHSADIKFLEGGDTSIKTIEPVGDSEFALLTALVQNMPLQAALDAAQVVDANFDLAAFLVQRVSDSTLAGFIVPTSTAIGAAALPGRGQRDQRSRLQKRDLSVNRA